MTPQKRWPNEADWARLDAISAIDRVIGQLIEIADRDLVEKEGLRKMLKSVNDLREAQTGLRKVGPRGEADGKA